MSHSRSTPRQVRAPRSRLWIGSLALLACACNGSISEPVAGDNKTSGGEPTQATGDADLAAGLLPLARLTRREYNNTVHDLLGDTTRPADQFPDDRDRDFLFRRSGLVAQQDADLLRQAAASLATTAVTNLSSLLPCDPATGEDACAQKFIGSFGPRAYRRPLAAEETTRLTALYTTARTTLNLGFADAIGVLIEGMLQAPAFLYHWESPYVAPLQEGAVVRLGSYEVASRLSYFLWGSLPDPTLFDAAAADKLVTEADIEVQARRMLADPRAKDSVAAFFNEWLETDTLADHPKDATLYPSYDDNLQTAMVGETSAFVKSVVFDGDGHLETLLDANFSFINQSLGVLYGVTGVQGDTLQKTNLDPAQRLGLLTQSSFLALNGASNGSHPVKRGKAVYEKLMCGVLPPPPANVPPAKPASAGGTTRQRFTEHDQNPCATACHVLMDPIGYAFEHYDGIGQYRTMDNGGVVDASGQLSLDGQNHTFVDAIGLIGVLAKSDTVRNCFATQWVRFAFDRPETDADSASIAHATAGFAANQYSIRDLLVAITSSRSFRYRSPAPGEVLP